MSRLYPILQRVWIGYFLAIVISLVGSYLFEVVIKGQSLSFDPSLNFLRTFGIGLFVGVLGLGTLTLLASRDRRRREREQQFSLFKSATDLTPEDFGFKRLGPGEPADPNLCPHYPAYFCRKVADTSSPSRVHEDEELARSALDNKGFLLIGPPLDGKTRTLYQVVSQLKGHIALAPFKDRPVPSDAAFSLIKGKDVILLLDDLSDYVESVVSLGGLAEKLNEYASHWVVAATCRDGPELSVVREAVQGGVSRFYEGIPMKLRLVPQDADEKHMLTASIGADWESENSDSYPTPGSITMAKPLEAMRLRFEKLQEDKKDVLRSLILLLLAGIPSLTHRRVQAVIEEVFQRNVLLGDCL